MLKQAGQIDVSKLQLNMPKAPHQNITTQSRGSDGDCIPGHVVFIHEFLRQYNLHIVVNMLHEFNSTVRLDSVPCSIIRVEIK